MSSKTRDPANVHSGPDRSEARTLLLEACRSASEGFLPCLLLPLIPCGRQQRAASPLQTGSATFLTGHRPSPVRGQFFPGAGDTLQILPSGKPFSNIVRNSWETLSSKFTLTRVG